MNKIRRMLPGVLFTVLLWVGHEQYPNVAIIKWALILMLFLIVINLAIPEVD
jgi:hypothetical protein